MSPTFLPEPTDAIYLIQAKARKQLLDSVVLAKGSGVKWCELATKHNGQNDG